MNNIVPLLRLGVFGTHCLLVFFLGVLGRGANHPFRRLASVCRHCTWYVHWVEIVFRS